MTLKVKKRYILDDLFLLFCLFYIYFWRWILKGYGQAYILFLLFFFAYCFRYPKSIVKAVLQPISVVLIVVFIMLFSGDDSVIFSNFVQLILPCLIITYIFSSIYNDFDRKNNFNNNLISGFNKFANIYFWINAVVIWIQSRGTYFLMTYNTRMYEDSVTGFIGSSGTHILCFTYIYLLFSNISKIVKAGNLPKKHRYMMMLALETLVMLYESSLNDNNMVYIFIPFALLMHVSNKNLLNSKILNRIVFGLVGLVIVFIGVMTVPTTRDFLNAKLFFRIAEFLGTNTSTYGERITLIIYSWENITSKFFGNGLGSIFIHNPEGFIKHFGMNDLSSLLYVGGCALILVLISYYYIFYSKVLEFKTQITKFVFLAYMVVLLLYTQPFTEISILIGLIFSLIAIYYIGVSRTIGNQ